MDTTFSNFQVDAANVISGVLALVVFVGSIVTATYRIVRHFNNKNKASIKADVIEQLEPVVEEIKAIAAQFRNNGGSTAKDAIDRIDKRTFAIEVRQREVKEDIAYLRDEQADTNAKLAHHLGEHRGLAAFGNPPLVKP